MKNNQKADSISIYPPHLNKDPTQAVDDVPTESGEATQEEVNTATSQPGETIGSGAQVIGGTTTPQPTQIDTVGGNDEITNNDAKNE